MIERVLEICDDAEATARRAVEVITDRTRSRAVERALSLAVSGGRTPARMFELLAGELVHWERVTVYQVDERIAPHGHPDRNLTTIERELPAATVVPMPVEEEDALAAAAAYASLLPGSIDVVHLGLGADGHTASLVPGDPVLDVRDRDVAVTRSYQGRRRMTLTYPALDRAGEILWVVTGDDKREALGKLLSGDEEIPATRIRTARQLVLADRAAAGR